nr:EAL domain-containing protein [uncultured Rhodopila sp.]
MNTSPSTRHFTTVVSAVVALVLLAVGGGSWLLTQHARQTAYRAAEANLRQASLIVESVVNHQFLQVDGALASLPPLLGIIIAGESDVPDPKAVNRLLRGLNFQSFAFRDIMLLNADGTVWASARPSSWSGRLPLPLAHLHPAASRGAASVLGPARNPVTGEWVVFVTRQITIPALGPMIAAAEVPLPTISGQFAAVGGTPGLRVFLERYSGELLVSQPYNEMEVGKPQPLTVGQAETGAQPFRLPETLSGVPTLAVVRTSLYADVLVVLTLDLNIALQDWVRDRGRLVVFSSAIAILICALALTLDIAHRHRVRADDDRNRARAMLHNAIEMMSDGFVMWDSEDRLITCNEQFRHMYEVSRALIVPGALFEDIIREGARRGQYPSMGEDLEAFVRETVAWRCSDGAPLERELPNGRWALITERRMQDGCIVGIRTDITNLKHAQSDLAAASRRVQEAMQEVQQQNIALRERDRALNIQNMLFDAALNNMSQGLLMTDSNQRLIILNHRFTEMFTIAPETFSIGLPACDALARIGNAGRLPGPVVNDMITRQRVLADARQAGNFLVAGADGFAVSVAQRPIADGGWLATYEDVTERYRAEEKVRHAAHHDALTGLPNRVLFHLRLTEMIGKLGYHETALALLCLDLDRFKQVNDTLGHPIGDRLLVAAGRRLLGCLKGDATVARLGGDEFAIAYIGPDARHSAEVVAERVIRELSNPYQLEGHIVTVGASIGVVIADSDQTNADTLLKNADLALYQAKSLGRGVYRVFEADMERQLLIRLTIEEDLAAALDRGEFRLFYQPLYDLGHARISGFEALLRWHHPVRGLVSPVHFIGIAEETGMIRRIGAWVIQQACEDALKLPPDVKVAVNLSPVQFEQCDIVGIIAESLDATSLSPNRLELEITESTLLESNAATLGALFQLRDMGLRIALDDFGTGYSSLTYLRRFPFDKIKIDRLFVCEMASREDCAAIVMSVVTLANRLGIITTAEGVETLEQLSAVRDAGCTEAQGYLISRPMPLQDALRFFDQPDPLADHIPQPPLAVLRNHAA